MLKQVLYLSFTLITLVATAQQAYYDDVNLTLTGQDLYFELQNKIDIDNNVFTYDDVKDAFFLMDENPSNPTEVLLVYGHNDSDGNCTTDRSRDKGDFGGGGCEYNREHVFARSRANPEMGDASSGSTGITADPHNLRPSDQQMNNDKGNRIFTSGSGNAGQIGGDEWYPGDEWKGDVARMMMYMYTRYGDRCLPSLMGTGGTQGSTDMLQLFIQWNVEDPVSALEDQRNPYLETAYGNRNPFIDNPYLATVIWGGPAAEDRWNFFDTDEFDTTVVSIYPNPSDTTIWVETVSAWMPSEYSLIDVAGRVILNGKLEASEKQNIDVSTVKSGVYFLTLSEQQQTLTKQIIIQ
ncbi:endonuclease [Luteirhabdus pelagi]|uniref:endonuclease n=1 Tax=Luteirhabdus pelagi TaxID=2792783 RepID=UPI00193A9890|nr:endonuclease [Luteirhabdus pelagi]